MNNNSYEISNMAQNNNPAAAQNFGRYQLASNGQYMGAVNSAPMFAAVDVSGGYNTQGATLAYQQYYQYTPAAVYAQNPEMYQNQLAYTAIPGAMAYTNAPPPTAFSRPPPQMHAAAQTQGGNGGQGGQQGQTRYNGQSAQGQTAEQYFNANNQNTCNQQNAKYSANQKVKQLSLFDNSSENYTASWVSSTSSIPPDLKVSPDHQSNPGSPHNEFACNWTNDQGVTSSGGAHNQLQHSNSVDEFAAGASATSGFSPPVETSLDQQLSQMNLVNNAAYNAFQAQAHQMPSMAISPVYFPTTGQTYYANPTGGHQKYANFTALATTQIERPKVAALTEFPQVAQTYGKTMDGGNGMQQQGNLGGNVNSGPTNPSSGVSSWANVVKRNGNISAGETRIRTVITEPPPTQNQGQHNTGITSGNGHDHNRSSAGAVGDNRNRNNRQNSRYQGGNTRYQNNRDRNDRNPGENQGQNLNNYGRKNDQNGVYRYGNQGNQQNSGNNQYQYQRPTNSPRGGNGKNSGNEGNYTNQNKVQPLNATQVPPPPMNTNHFVPQQQPSASPLIMHNVMANPQIQGYFMAPNNGAHTGYSPQTMQQHRPFQPGQWQQAPVPLAAINPGQQFISRATQAVHNGQPHQAAYSAMGQPTFPPPNGAPPNLMAPMYGNNQGLTQQKSNFKGTWLDQDTLPKDQMLIQAEMAWFVQSHNHSIATFKAAKNANPNNPGLRAYQPVKGGLLYLISEGGQHQPHGVQRYGSPKPNPNVRRLKHNQTIQRGKGGSPLKAYKKKSTDEEPQEISPEKTTQEDVHEGGAQDEVKADPDTTENANLEATTPTDNIDKTVSDVKVEPKEPEGPETPEVKEEDKEKESTDQ